MNVTTAVEDVWHQGTIDKTAAWSYYIAANYIGVALCTILMFSVWKNHRKTSIDVLIAGLCSGCLWMSITCGSQCLVSVIHHYFYGSDIACQLEAFFHVSAILVQFFMVTTIALRSYLAVVRQYTISLSLSYGLVLSIWITCVLVTYLLSLVSPIYLMTAGTYCFFGFSSPAIAYWLLPGLVVSLLTMIICYIAIWQTFRASTKRVAPSLSIPQPTTNETKEHGEGTTGRSEPADSQHMVAPAVVPIATIGAVQATALTGSASLPITSIAQESIQQKMIMTVALRSAWFIAVLLGGWFFAAIASVYELDVGLTPEWLVTAVGVAGVTHSIAVPLTYAYSSKFHLKTMRHVIQCQWRLCCRRSKNPNAAFSVASANPTSSMQKSLETVGTKSKPVLQPLQIQIR